MRETFAEFISGLAAWLEEEDMPRDEADYYRALYEAWALGGSVAAGIAIKQYDRLSDFWGKGDEDKALGITEAFTLGMATAWYEELNKEDARPESERAEAVTVSAGNVLEFFDDFDDETVSDFLVVDRQLSHDLRKNGARSEGFSIWGYAMLAALAESLGGGPRPAFERASFPIENSASLEAIGVPDSVLNGLVTLPTAFNLGAAGMFEHYAKTRGAS